MKTVRANSLRKPAQKLSGKFIAVTGLHREHFHKMGCDSCKLEIEFRETSQDLARTVLQNTFVDAEIVENSIKVGKRARVIEILLSKYKAKSSCRPGICEIKIDTDFEYRPTLGAEGAKSLRKPRTKLWQKAVSTLNIASTKQPSEHSSGAWVRFNESSYNDFATRPVSPRLPGFIPPARCSRPNVW